MIKNIDSSKTYIIHLMACALHNIKPKEKPQSISWESLLKFADFHSVAGLTYLSIQMLDNKPEVGVLTEWKEKYNKEVAKEIIQNAELNHLSRVFLSDKIMFLPLKGSVLLNLYPKKGMRSRADIDILIREEDAVRVHDIMINEGYDIGLYEDCHHDTYYKKPVLNVEIHRGILPETMESCCDYYKDIWDRLTVDKNNPCHCYMSNEDFYIFQVVHLYKHYMYKGSGLRSIMDIYVLNDRMRDKWNIKMINSVLTKLGLADFEKEIRELSYHWFGNETADEVNKETASYILSSGTYGLNRRIIEKEINKRGRFGYFMYRTFLPYEELKCKYQVLERFKILLPIFWVWRLIEALFNNRNAVVDQFRSVFIKMNRKEE